MKIYKLTVRKRRAMGSQVTAMISSYVTPEDDIRTSFFLHKGLAEFESKKVIEAAFVLYGPMHEITTYINEVEVAE